MEKITIVIAEDIEEILQSIKKVFERDKTFEILGIAKNGKELLDLIKQTKPRVVLTDVSMPIYTGIEVAEMIYNDKTINSEFFILSAEISEIITKCRSLEIYHIYSKPIDVEVLMNSIKQSIL